MSGCFHALQDHLPSPGVSIILEAESTQAAATLATGKRGGGSHPAATAQVLSKILALCQAPSR
jgi:hypothetical protein